jgi:hypothetical protein
MEFNLKFIFAAMLPVSAAFVLLLYSIKPEESVTENNIGNQV